MNAVSPADWSFWTAALAGENPETTPGIPHQGFYIAKQYVSVPHGAKRVLVDFPVAIWFDGATWRSRIDDLKYVWSHDDVGIIDEMFARCCRNPITHARYLEMLATLEDYRK